MLRRKSNTFHRQISKSEVISYTKYTKYNVHENVLSNSSFHLNFYVTNKFWSIVIVKANRRSGTMTFESRWNQLFCDRMLAASSQMLKLRCSIFTRGWVTGKSVLKVLIYNSHKLRRPNSWANRPSCKKIVTHLSKLIYQSIWDTYGYAV